MQQAHPSELSSLLSNPVCTACGGPMRLVLIEPNEQATDTDTRHFTCVVCGATEIKVVREEDRAP